MVGVDLGWVKLRARTPIALASAVSVLAACGSFGGGAADTSTRPATVPDELARVAVPAGGEWPHWAYQGAEGPEHWAELAEDWAVCGTGEEQSPIDVTAGVPFVARPTTTTAAPAGAEAELPATTAKAPAKGAVPGGSTTTTEPEWRGAPAEQEIRFDYRASAYTVVDTDHVVQVNVQDAGGVEIDGVRFTLTQLHFHTPSEHTLAGAAYPVEYHLVHTSERGEIAVVGVLVQLGATNETLAPILSALPTGGATAAGTGTLDPAELLPPNRTMVRYNGSLTTPPCSQHVRWHLLLAPVQLSSAQVAALTAVHPGSARPTQEVGDREIVVEVDAVTSVEGAERPAEAGDAEATAGH